MAQCGPKGPVRVEVLSLAKTTRIVWILGLQAMLVNASHFPSMRSIIGIIHFPLLVFALLLGRRKCRRRFISLSVGPSSAHPIQCQI